MHLYTPQVTWRVTSITSPNLVLWKGRTPAVPSLDSPAPSPVLGMEANSPSGGL